jgi:hypothetical protein
MSAKMKRREFFLLLGGAAAAGPFAAHAQQSEQKRRVGVLMGLSADDVQAQDRIAAFVQGRQQYPLSKTPVVSRF